MKTSDIPEYATLRDYTNSEHRQFLSILKENFKDYDFRLKYHPGNFDCPDLLVYYRGIQIGSTLYIKQVTEIVGNHINSLKLADKMKKSIRKAGLLRRRRSRDLSLRSH